MNACASQADMLCPFHNGGRPHYQSYSGGVVGATWHAAPLLDKAIIPVPWWCECHTIRHMIFSESVHRC